MYFLWKEMKKKKESKRRKSFRKNNDRPISVEKLIEDKADVDILSRRERGGAAQPTRTTWISGTRALRIDVSLIDWRPIDSINKIQPGTEWISRVRRGGWGGGGGSPLPVAEDARTVPGGNAPLEKIERNEEERGGILRYDGTLTDRGIWHEPTEDTEQGMGTKGTGGHRGTRTIFGYCFSYISEPVSSCLATGFPPLSLHSIRLFRSSEYFPGILNGGTSNASSILHLLNRVPQSRYYLFSMRQKFFET